MGVFHIRKGKDLKIKGAAEKKIVAKPLPSRVAIVPPNFRGVKFSLAVKEGDMVKVGTPLLCDRTHPEIKFVSPASGKVLGIIRGLKRVLVSVIVETDSKQEAEQFKSFTPQEIQNLSPEQILPQLLQGGLWPTIRQRPFAKIAHTEDQPKSIFIHAMNTEPLALDIDFILQDKQNDFQAGLDILRKLTKGKTHLCYSIDAKSKALLEAKNVEKHRFAGPHPAGNISTHIHHVDPIKKGDIVWYIEAQDVLRVARLFLNGTYSPEHYVALTGEGIGQRSYVKTVVGASIPGLLEGQPKEGLRYISGSVLAGNVVGKQGFVGYYDSQVTVIPEGGKREFLGWLWPGFNKYSFSKTFASSLAPQKETSLTTDKNGSDRAIVMNQVYDDYVAIDVLPFFLLRSIISGDIEEAEKLGILECDEEDFALCTFACPSKFDVGSVIREGLDIIEKEG